MDIHYMNTAANTASHASSAARSQISPVVFVVESDPSEREGLERLIRSAGWRPETYASAGDFLSRRRTFAPSCLILDLELADLSGLELQKRIATDQAGMPVIFVADRADVATAVRAMKAGAVDFLTKPCSDNVLRTAICSAIERSTVALRREADIRAIEERYESLSSRERAVMALVISGLINKRIGAELGIAEITVKTHRGCVMRKMKAGSLPDLVRMAAVLPHVVDQRSVEPLGDTSSSIPSPKRFAA